MTDTPSNFLTVFKDSLTPENLAAFESLDPNVNDMVSVWDIVLRNYVRVSNPNMFVSMKDKDIISDEAFAELHAPIVGDIPNGMGEVPMDRGYRSNPVKYAYTDLRLSRAKRVVYEPGLPEWLPGRTEFNVYRPAGYEPLEGRPEIILAHLRYLIPDKWEFSLVIAYIKWMVQNPDKKMKFALLIIGKKGTGKSWLSSFFEALFGAHNVYVLEKGSRITKDFNSLEANRQVIFIDELVPDKVSLAGAIEPKIVGKGVTIERKGVDPFIIPNRYNVIAISNHETAIKIASRTDRKWLVVRARTQVFGAKLDDPEREATEYYDMLYKLTEVGATPAMVSDEIRKALWWFKNTPITKDWEEIDLAVADVDAGEVMLRPFNGLGAAPSTPTKDDVAAINETTIESTLRGAFVEKSQTFRFELFTVEDVHNAFVSRDKAFEVTETRGKAAIIGEIGTVLDDLGCERLNSHKQVNLWPGKPKRPWVRSGELLAKYDPMTNAEIVKAYHDMRKGKKPDANADAVAAFGDDNAEE